MLFTWIRHMDNHLGKQTRMVMLVSTSRTHNTTYIFALERQFNTGENEVSRNTKNYLKNIALKAPKKSTPRRHRHMVMRLVSYHRLVLHHKHHNQYK